MCPDNLFIYGRDFRSLKLASNEKPRHGERVTQSNKSLRSREERTHNIVPISPYDVTSQAYHRETPQSKEVGMGFAMSLVMWAFFIAFLFYLLELIVGSWEQFK